MYIHYVLIHYISYIYGVYLYLQLQDMLDNEYIQSLTQAPSKRSDEPKTNDRGFVIKNAPWDSAPDTSSTSEFPSFPGAGSGNAVAPNSNKAWGPGRRY
jgi:hypothetical protein